MKKRFWIRLLACGTAGVLLIGGAFALKAGESVVSLNYLKNTFQPAAVEKGKQTADAMLQKTYDSALNEWKTLNPGTTGGQADPDGSSSPDLRSREFHRDDIIRLETGASILLTDGKGKIVCNGTVVDATKGTEVSSGSTLTQYHRYLAAENTTAQVTVKSGLARIGMQGVCSVTESGSNSAPFVDVYSGDWYVGAVDYVYANGLLSGVGGDRFEPNVTMSRAMMVAVLYRLAGSPEQELNQATATFKDVASGDWYAPFARWAASQNVTSGIGDGRFGPNQNVSRQQVAVMLYSFAQNRLGLTFSGGADLSQYSDAKNVATWAQTAMSWAVEQGILAGNGGAIMPDQSATRAQVSIMIQNFSKNFL